MSLVLDTNPINQPQGTYRFAKNVIRSTVDAASTTLSSEPGLETIYEFPENWEIIGKIYYSDNLLIFATNNEDSEIGTLTNGEYKTVYKNTDLNFSKSHPILGTHRILAGCEDVFYWSDGFNPDRYLNLTKIPDSTNKLDFTPELKLPNIEFVGLEESGGKIPSGSVRFQVKYVDVRQNVFFVSNPTTYSIPIYNDRVSQYALGSEQITNKSIRLRITNVDTQFSFLKLIALHSKVDTETITVYEMDTLYPISDSINITYRGPDNNSIVLDNRDTLIEGSNYNNSLAITQVQNRLVRANVQEVTEDYSKMQQLANQVKTSIKTVPLSKDVFTQSPEYYYKYMSLQSEEVYALAIKYKNTDTGKYSPPFHIPGTSPTARELELVDFNDTKFPRYRLEDTSTVLEINGFYVTTRLGAYITDTTYPTIKDCKGGSVFGALAGTPIRHHKVPSRTKIPLFKDDKINQLVFTFDNIQFPEGYNDYEILYVPRDDFNSTVLDAGFLTYKGAYYYEAELISEDAPVALYEGPQTHLHSINRGDYFSLVYKDIFSGTRGVGETIEGYQDFLDVGWGELKSGGQTIVSENVPYTTAAYIGPNQVDFTNFIGPVETSPNRGFGYFYDVQPPSKVPVEGKLEERYYGLNKSLTIPNENLFSLRYTPLTKYKDYYIGDTFINRMHSFDIIDTTFYYRGKSRYGPFQVVLKDIYVESKINFNLVYGEHVWNGDRSNVIEHMVNQVTVEGDTVINNAPEFKYQDAYSTTNPKLSFPLPQTYDYCNKCRSKFPNRIIYSAQSFSEELNDTYLLRNSVNDYIDLPANTGPITGIKYKNGKLYVHTTQTTYVLSPNPQYLTTNDQVAQLSTGDFLSIPAQEIIQTDYGYGGLQDKMGTINCEFGYFWLDGLRGSLNSITDSFSSVSSAGMMNWFKVNTNANTRVRMGFDPYYSRLLLTLRGYREGYCTHFHTLSYHLPSSSFTAYHDYNPDIYLNNSSYFSSCYGPGIKRHLLSSGYNEFPAVIEWVDTKLQTHNLISLSWYVEFFEGNEEVRDTFSHYITYNSNQSTGTQKLYIAGPYDTLFSREGAKPVVITDKNQSTSNIWDNAVSTKVSEAPDLSCDYFFDYRDKEFSEVNNNKDPYSRALFREKYTITRMTYKPEKDRRMTYYILTQNKQQSIR